MIEQLQFCVLAMATIAPFYNIILTPDDVPGAKLCYEDISQHSNCQLKRWLECRGLPVKGCKPDLVKRCQDCMSAGNSLNISIAVDGGKWYQKKAEDVLASITSVTNTNRHSNSVGITSCDTIDLPKPLLTVTVPQPPILPVTGWKKFPTNIIPKNFCYGDIYHHIIVSAKVIDINNNDGDENSADFSTSKPMQKGRQYFTSGHVCEMEDNSKSEFYFLKAKVRPSFDNDVRYNVSVSLNKGGAVVDSSCECKSSAMGRCSHVAGLLFALEDYTIQFGYEPGSVSCTSKLCQWNVGRKKNKNPQPAHVSSYSKKLTPDRIILHDPRPPISNQEEADAVFLTNFITTLPNASQEKCMFSFLLEITYDDYALTAERQEILVTLTKIFIESMKEDMCSVPHEVQDTIAQVRSEKWHQIRRWRITASRCKDFFTIRSDRGLYNLLKSSIWGYKGVETSGMVYGMENEGKALVAYSSSLHGTGLLVHKTGFWVNPLYPEMGCSPDGLVYNKGSLVGVVEIKCPSVLKNIHPLDAHSKLTKQQYYSFCCYKENDVLKLKKSHKYYYQIQMQMAICDVIWCDFIVWSSCGIHVQRIQRDPEFWQKTYSTLIAIYQSVVVPEIFEMRIPRRLFPFKLDQI